MPGQSPKFVSCSSTCSIYQQFEFAKCRIIPLLYAIFSQSITLNQFTYLATLLVVLQFSLSLTYLASFEIIEVNRQTDNNLLTQYTITFGDYIAPNYPESPKVSIQGNVNTGVCRFFLTVKFATSLLALLAGGSSKTITSCAIFQKSVPKTFEYDYEKDAR